VRDAAVSEGITEELDKVRRERHEFVRERQEVEHDTAAETLLDRV
jgi:hypothetical protein